MTILFTIQCWDITPNGLPHSDISGSKPAYGSPKLFAVNHVLLRLLAPRHPPYALIILTFFTHISMRARFSVIRRLRLYLFRFPTSCVMQFSKNSGLLAIGGDEGNRTPCLLLARQALSQMSYTPICTDVSNPPRKWWAWMDSNHRPHAYQACALTT